MLKAGVCSCDICDEVIPKGEKYAVSIVLEARAQLFRSLNRIRGRKLVRRVVADRDQSVVVCNEEEYAKAAKERRAAGR